MRAAIYIRVSSDEQVDGWSLDAQRDQCRALAAMRKWTVVQLYEEPGISAKTDQRPVFQQMMRAAIAHRFDVIVVHKLDPLCRLGSGLACADCLHRAPIADPGWPFLNYPPRPRTRPNFHILRGDRLFPTAEEFGTLMAAVEDESKEWRLMHSRDKELDWKQYALLFQGIIERTPAFQPLLVHGNKNFHCDQGVIARDVAIVGDLAIEALHE
jgi:hypothetical protein